MSAEKAKILLVGSGGVGTMAAYALETGGKAAVTAVLRSNYDVVNENGFEIDSIDHGSDIKGFRPSALSKKVPDVSDEEQKFDYIVVTTKNVPEISPTVVDIIRPAVTPGYSTILLLQNGLNIEKPLIKAFPTNPLLSGISMIGAGETQLGKIRHDDKDILKIGAFESPKVPQDIAQAAAKRFVDMYSACGKVDCVYEEDVLGTRWRKLIYNACYNSVAAILQMDTARLRIYDHCIDELVKPCMLEIKAIAAAAAGVVITDEEIDRVIRVDRTDIFPKPSMQQDVEKGNYIECENILGEPLGVAKRLGVPAPTLTVIYAILKGYQVKAMESRGVVKPVFSEHSKYK